MSVVLNPSTGTNWNNTAPTGQSVVVNRDGTTNSTGLLDALFGFAGKLGEAWLGVERVKAEVAATRIRNAGVTDVTAQPPGSFTVSPTMIVAGIGGVVALGVLVYALRRK